MRRILRRHEVVTDTWQYLGEEGLDTPSSGPLIVPFAEYTARPQFWRERDGSLGIRLSPADEVETLKADLPRFGLVAAEFPSPGEGRGYTQGHLLRARLKFKGELRAVGAGVKQDLIFLMARCGFDAFDLAPGQSFDAAIAAFKRYTVAYQPAEPLESIRQLRFHA